MKQRRNTTAVIDDCGNSYNRQCPRGPRSAADSAALSHAVPRSSENTTWSRDMTSLDGQRSRCVADRRVFHRDAVTWLGVLDEIHLELVTISVLADGWDHLDTTVNITHKPSTASTSPSEDIRERTNVRCSYRAKQTISQIMLSAYIHTDFIAVI